MQISLFDGNNKFKINKPIRLIELFAGIGSQAKALKNLGVDFEHYRICEFDKYAVVSYNAVHGTNFETSDITKITAKDLGIVDTDKYCYIMTYSFPCQDLSSAGLGKGMAKGSGTRSGLLWEVERLLDECEKLPQVLLMENVPQVIGQNNIQHFAKWIEKLEQLGYKNKWQVLNAKDYGIPQNRERCFMVSILGDYYYDFPKTIPLTLRLKDMLETEVEHWFRTDNCFSIPSADVWFELKGLLNIQTDEFDKSITEFIEKPNKFESSNRAYSDNVLSPTITATTSPNVVKVADDIKPSVRENYVRDKEKIAKSDKDIFMCDCTSGFNDNKVGIKLSPTIRAGNSHTAVYNNLLIRKLTPKECWRLMGFADKDIDNAIAIGMSNAQLYKQAGNSICVQVLMAIFKEML